MDERVLVLAPRGRDARIAGEVLARAGIGSAACADVSALCAGLEAGADAALLTEESLAGEDLSGITAWLEAQPAWSDFPFVVLAAPGAGRRSLAGSHILERLGNVVLLERPLQADTIVSAARAALRARRRQYDARTLVQERERDARTVRDILESISDAFFTLDHDLRLTYVNRHAEGIWQRRAEDLLGRRFLEAFPQAAHSPAWVNYLQVLETRRSVEFEVFSPIVHRWLAVSIYPAPGGGLTVYFRDVSERRSAREALRESDARLAFALNAGRLGSWDLDFQSRELHVSEICAASFGRRPEELASYSSLLKAIHPDDRERQRAVVRQAMATRADLDVEYRTIWPDGGVHWLQVRGRASYAEDGTPLRLAGVSLDVTSRRQADAALRERNARLQLLSNTASALLTVDDLDTVLDPLLRTVTERFGVDFCCRFLVEDEGGALRLVSCTGAAEAAAAELGRDGPVHAFDAAAARIMRPMRAIEIQDSEAAELQQLKALGLRTYYCQPLLAGGRLLGTLSFGARNRDAFDEAEIAFFQTVAHYVAVVRQRQRADAELRSLNETLEMRVAARTAELEEAGRRLAAEAEERRHAEALLAQAHKMEAVGQLTGGMAHDFNNLLTAVIGSLELLERRVTDEKSRRNLDVARRASERGAKLIAQLLAFSRKQRLERAPVDINRLLGGMDDLLGRTLGATVSRRRDFAPDLWPALVDANQVETALLNIAVNARDAMPAGGGGVFSIATANLAAGNPDLPAEVRERDCVLISMADNGCGMSQEVLAKVFEPFFTTKEIGKGTGLGLPQVYGMAQQSGGTVRILSRVGEGTIVQLYLPRAELDAELPARFEAGLQRRDGGASILVVDDDHDVRELTLACLRECGHSVTGADSGQAALELLEGGLRCELMLIDMAMPGMSGPETVRQARRRRPDLRVVFATGYADVQVFGDSDDPIVRKPFSIGALTEAVRDALCA